jgi:tetrahydromethanopterin S-methyltransferase subunit G
MPIAVPETVRRALGEEAVVDFIPWMEGWLTESIREKAVPRDEYRELLSRLDGLEKDISLVKEEQTQMRAEFRQEQAQMRAEFREDLGELRREMHERFDRMNQCFDAMNERLDQMNQHFESRLDQMSERMLIQTRWLIGTIALFGTILTIMMAIAQFAP